MSDNLPDHEGIDKYCRELPKEIIGKLPDSIEQREALRLADVMSDLAHQAREKVKPS